MRARFTRGCLGAAGPLLALATLGCHPPTTPAPAPPTENGSGADTQSPDPDQSTNTCEKRNERFVDYGFVGADVRAAASLDLSSPDVESAIAAIATRARTTDHGWPIAFAFSAGQWGWQIALLRSTLATAGFEPPELVYVAFEDGASLWAWSSSCDLRTTAGAVEAAWGLQLEPTAYGALARAETDAEGNPNFPYDLVVFGSEFFGFAPAGRGHNVAQHLAASRRGDPAARLGTDLAAVDPAPIRAVMPTLALLGSGSEAPDGGRLQIRADRDGVTDAIAPALAKP